MQRLTKYEIFVVVGAILVAVAAVIGYLASLPTVLTLSLLALLLLILISIILAIVRLDRVLSGQKRAREEIYQVLYWLHGNDKLTEAQAEETRDLLRRNHQALVSEVQKAITESTDDKRPGDLSDGDRAVAHLEEAERLRFNKLIGILDAQWSLLENLRQSILARKS